MGTYDNEYRKNRAILLADSPPCHWCGAPATEADHLVPVAAGGDNDLANLAPACKRCNASRGAKLGNKKRASNKRNSKKSFLEEKKSTPSHPFSFLSERSLDTPAGHDQPRLLAMRKDAAGSFGPAAADLYERLTGITLMPWQRITLDGQLAYSSSGKLSHRIALTSVARQNGKTLAQQALALWWLVERSKTHGPQVVVSTAHLYDVAVMGYHALAPLLVEHYGGKALWSHGRETLKLPDGSKWIVLAAKPQRGHGLTVDLAILDEIWAISSSFVDTALWPAQRARPDPLFSMWSTAGTDHSEVMQRYRDMGVKAIDQPSHVFFAEWSAPAGSEHDDHQAWAMANPALGHTITIEQLELEAASPARSAFLRGALNMWVSDEDAWLAPGVWPALELERQPAPGGALFVEARTGESRYFVLRGERNGDAVHVTYLGEHDTLRKLWADLEQRLTADPSLAAYVGAGLESSIPTKWAKRIELVGRRELLAGTRFARSMIVEGRVTHCGSSVLGDHVARAVAVEMGGGYTLSSKLSPGPVELARCLIWAVTILGREEKKRERPAVVVAGRPRPTVSRR